MRALFMPFALVLLSACAGQPLPDLSDPSGASSSASGTSASSSATGGGGSDARQFFEDSVSPIVDTECASCHSAAEDDPYSAPDFLGGSPAEYYEMLTGNIDFVNANPGTSQFLTKGKHTGPAFTADESDLVEHWLAMEAYERFEGGTGEGGGGEGPPPGPTGEEATEAFGDCMTFDDWTAAGMPDVGSQGTLADGPCHKCHQSGVGANYMTSSANEASISDGFESVRHGAPLLKLITWTVDPETGQLLDIVQSKRWIDKGSEGTGHPKYVLTAPRVQAMDDWFELAHAKWESGACGAGGGGP